MLLLVLVGLVFSDFMIILNGTGEPSLLIVTNGPVFHALGSSSVAVSEGSSFSLLCMVMESGFAVYDQIAWVRKHGQLKYDVVPTTYGQLNFAEMTVGDTGEYSCYGLTYKLMRMVYITVVESEVSSSSPRIQKRDVGAYDSLPEYPPFDDKTDYDRAADGNGGGKVNELVELETKTLVDLDQKDSNKIVDPNALGSLDMIGPPLVFSIGIIVFATLSTAFCIYKAFSKDNAPSCTNGGQSSHEQQQDELDEVGPSRADTPLQRNGADLPPTYSSLMCNELRESESPPPYSSTLRNNFFTQRFFSAGLNAAPPLHLSTVSVPAATNSEEQAVIEVPRRPLSLPYPSVSYSFTPASSCAGSSGYGKCSIDDSTSNDSVSDDE